VADVGGVGAGDAECRNLSVVCWASWFDFFLQIIIIKCHLVPIHTSHAMIFITTHRLVKQR
jgi:hypothetical protein